MQQSASVLSITTAGTDLTPRLFARFPTFGSFISNTVTRRTDIAKDHPDVVFDVCRKWLNEIEDSDDPVQAKNRRWIVKHAVRLPAKKKEPRAIGIRKAGADPKKRKS